MLIVNIMTIYNTKQCEGFSYKLKYQYSCDRRSEQLHYLNTFSNRYVIYVHYEYSALKNV